MLWVDCVFFFAQQEEINNNYIRGTNAKGTTEKITFSCARTYCGDCLVVCAQCVCVLMCVCV